MDKKETPCLAFLFLSNQQDVSFIMILHRIAILKAFLRYMAFVGRIGRIFRMK